MAINPDKQRAKIDKMVEALAKEQARLMLAEKAEQRRKAREEAAQRRKERAAMFRAADAHKKIVLGGLTIAAGVDDWNEAEIVGALLVADEKLKTNPELRAKLRAKGLQHLQAREAARKSGGK